MTPHKPQNDGRGDDDELHRTPDPIHEDYRYMIRSTYQDMRLLKESVGKLVEARNQDNVRIDRLEQSHKNNVFWIRTLAATAVTAVGGSIWALLTSGHVKPPSPHP